MRGHPLLVVAAGERLGSLLAGELGGLATASWSLSVRWASEQLGQDVRRRCA